MVLYFKSAALFISLLFWYDTASTQNLGTLNFSDPRQIEEGVEALMAQATSLEHAEGVRRDYPKAFELYCIAAKAGHPAAFYALGWMYANARGVIKDEDVAGQLFKLAADQGHAYAQVMLQFFRSPITSILPACLLTTPLVANDESLAQPPQKTGPHKGPVFELVKKLAPAYEIDPRLVLAVIAIESGFDAKAVSPKNAQGLMQLMPETAQRFRVKNPFDPEENIKGGLAYLRWLLAYFKGNVALVAAAYNAGERAVEAHKGIPPYPETRNYVLKISRLYDKAVHPYQASIVDASPLVSKSGNGRK